MRIVFLLVSLQKAIFFYHALCGGIMPSDRSIRDYRKIYKSIYQLILSFTLIATRKMDLSSFYHVSADGTIKIACNSSFNTIKRKDIQFANQTLHGRRINEKKKR